MDSDDDLSFEDALDDLTSVIQEQVQTSLLKANTAAAFTTLHQYLSNPNDLSQEEARDKLLCTNSVREFYKANNCRVVDKERDLRFIKCLNKLLNYAEVLLKPVNKRSEYIWKVIRTSEPTFKEYITPFNSYSLVMNALGYEHAQFGSIFTYNDSSDLAANLREVCSDLLVLRAYTEVKLGIKGVTTSNVVLKSEDKIAGGAVCVVCSAAALYYCEHEQCMGKVWCLLCNIKWHRTNPERENHPHKPIPTGPAYRKPLAVIPVSSAASVASGSTPSSVPAAKRAAVKKPADSDAVDRKPEVRVAKVPSSKSAAVQKGNLGGNSKPRSVSESENHPDQPIVSALPAYREPVAARPVSTVASVAPGRDPSVPAVMKPANRKPEIRVAKVLSAESAAVQKGNLTGNNKPRSVGESEKNPRLQTQPSRPSEVGDRPRHPVLPSNSRRDLKLTEEKTNLPSSRHKKASHTKETVRQQDNFLKLLGMKCSACKAWFHLPDGGSMDGVCPKCGHKFCKGCGTQLHPNECPREGQFGCGSLDLHGHHPRNCPTYLADYTADELKKLLRHNNILFDSGASGGKCRQMLEDESYGKFRCDEDEVENGMCRRHYTEYLTATINKHKLEVLSLMSISQLVMVLMRGEIICPDQAENSGEEYRKKLVAEISDKLPLQDLSAWCHSLSQPRAGANNTEISARQGNPDVTTSSQKSLSNISANTTDPGWSKSRPESAGNTTLASYTRKEPSTQSKVKRGHSKALKSAPKDQPVPQEEPVYKQEIRNLELLVNETLLSKDIGLFESRINTMTLAMDELHIKIAEEPAHSTKKGQFNTELIALSKYRERFEERLDELRKDALSTSSTSPTTKVSEKSGETAEDVTIRVRRKDRSDTGSPCPVPEVEDTARAMDEILQEVKELQLHLLNVCPVKPVAPKKFSHRDSSSDHVTSRKANPAERSDASTLTQSTSSSNIKQCAICFDDFPPENLNVLCCHDTSTDGMGCCKDCVADHFRYQIENENMANFKCPIEGCYAGGKKISADQMPPYEFFQNLLDLVFPYIPLPQEMVTRFNGKLTCWSLSTEPNFHWCTNARCSYDGYGFIDEHELPRISCPRCQTSIKCRSCRRPWKAEHEERSCEEFAAWERENSDDYIDGVKQRDEFLDLYGITCPSCKSRFHLAKGGCMDCDCPTCNFKFCNGCGTQMYPKDCCPRDKELKCNTLGLHGHHPRNCHYFLRDCSALKLKKLLLAKGVAFESGVTGYKCQLILEDENNCKIICDTSELENGMCRRHYTEYLTATINKHKLEVVKLMSLGELQRELTRNGITCPIQGDSSNDDYRNQLCGVIKRHLPLKDLSAYKIY